MWSRTSGLVRASTTLWAIVLLRPVIFFEVVELKSPSELRRLICRVTCLAVPISPLDFLDLHFSLDRIGLLGVLVFVSELFTIDVFGWELDKSKFVSEVISFLFTFVDAAILVSIVQLTNVKSGIE